MCIQQSTKQDEAKNLVKITNTSIQHLTKLLCQCFIYNSFLSRRVIVEAIKDLTYFSVSHIYTHTNNQTNRTVCNLQLISWAMCTKTFFLLSLTLISWRLGGRQRLINNRLTLHSSIASSKRNTVKWITSNLHRRITSSNENKITIPYHPVV